MKKKFAALFNGLLRLIAPLFCRLDIEDLKLVPSQGPLILVANHVNFLEVPLLVAHLQPRPLTGFVKSENWKMPFFRQLFTLWEGIPIDRGTVDRDAFNLGLQALEQGKILAIAPEGTRSGDGRLLPGKPGVVPVALRSGAPLIPLVYYGSESFWENLKHLRRTDFHIRVGKPFQVSANGAALSRETRQTITDEIMYRMAELLPEQYRGHYSFKKKIQYQFVKDIG